MQTLKTETQEPFFTEEHRNRILSHMNEDHADAVLHYARHFGGKAEATAATLAGIDQLGIDLEVASAGGDEVVRVAFDPPLATPDEAHHALIRMAKAGRSSADGAAVDASNLERAREAVRQLRTHAKTILLGTVGTEGMPDCSVAPWISLEPGVLLTYISDLSAHTRNLRGTGRASVLLIEDEASSAHLLARRRLTFQCVARFMERGGPVFAAAMEQMRGKYGAVMQHLAGMEDFHLVELRIESARLVAGFGQAYDAEALDWENLRHVGGGGHGHRKG